MSHTLKHVPFETIESFDFDRWMLLIREGIILDSAGIRTSLHGAIKYEDLSPELQSLFAITRSSTKFIGDGVKDTFPLSSPPISGTVSVFLNGALQDPIRDYVVSGSNLIMTDIPSLGDVLIAQFGTAQAMKLTKLGSFAIDFMQISDIENDNSFVYTYGINKVGGAIEVAKYRPTDLVRVNPTLIDVSAGDPFHSRLAFANNYLWAIGSPTGGFTNQVTQINADTMTPTVVPVTGDTGMIAKSMVSDGTNLYVLLEGGAPTSNVVVRISPSGPPYTTVIVLGTLPALTGVDMAISSAGYLFIAFPDLGKVRKYDLATGNLMATFSYTHPIRVVAVNADIYVLDDTAKKLHKISLANVPTEITTFMPALPTATDMMFDGIDLWISYGDLLRKLDHSTGLMLQETYPEGGLNIRDISFGFGSVWTSYSNDLSGPTDVNITRLYPGLPGS